MDDTVNRRRKRCSNAISVVALCIAHLACNAPSTEGLYGLGGSGAGAGGVGGMGGSGGLSGAGGAGAGNGGGSGRGGGASGDSGAGGTVFEPPDASAADAAVPFDAGIDAATVCGGALIGGICWYLGAVSESCNQVCSPRGGFDTATIEVIGTEAQGGSLEECNAVLEVLLGPGIAAQSGTQAVEGVGCHLYEDDGQLFRWWLSAPEFSANASLVGVPLACGCNE